MKVQGVAQTAGRVMVGHHSGLRNSLRTQSHLRVLRRDNPVHESGAAEGAASQLRRVGLLRPDHHYPDDLIRYLTASASFAHDPSTSVAMGGRIPESVRYALAPLEQRPRLAELLTPELASIVRAYYGTEFRVSCVRLWRIAHIPEAERAFHHYGNLWHLDGHPVDVLKMFVQVSESPQPCRGDGAELRVVSRIDTRQALVRGYVNPDRILPNARQFLEAHCSLFDGPPGTVLFADTDRCLHRAGNPAPHETRGMVQFMFLPSSTPPPNGDYCEGLPPDPNVKPGGVA
jgi:hypothetical protein